MPTSVTYTIPISGGEHVIRFLNLSGDEIFLGNVPVSFAEVLTETGTPLEAVNSTWRQGVSITESLTAIVELELGSDLRETATALDSLQAFHAMLTSESDEALADEASDSTATNIEPSEIDESLTGVVEFSVGIIQNASIGERITMNDEITSRVKKGRKIKRIIFRWGE